MSARGEGRPREAWERFVTVTVPRREVALRVCKEGGVVGVTAVRLRIFAEFRYTRIFDRYIVSS